jgi:hypothetical protein
MCRGTQVDIMLYPGKGRVVAINYKTTIGKSDIEKAVGWLLNHMEKIPGCGSDRVLPDTSVNVRSALVCFSPTGFDWCLACSTSFV